MTEQEFRNRLRELGIKLVEFSVDPNHDLSTALEQARQTLALMQSEWRHIARHQVPVESGTSGAP